MSLITVKDEVSNSVFMELASENELKLRGRIFNQAGNELWTRSFIARNYLFNAFPKYLMPSCLDFYRVPSFRFS
jgi:hypothetical protein